MNNQNPKIEIASGWNQQNPPVFVSEPWFKTNRFKIFIISLAVSLLISLTYVFTQAAVYQSYASLLTVAKTAIDQQSSEADIQHVVIQKQILLGHDLIAETARRLKLSKDMDGSLTLTGIHQMLDVEPVENTNLIKLIAEGPKPTVLPVLINTWVDVYLESSKKEVSLSTDSITDSLKSELQGLSDKIQAKRSELDVFRKDNNIASDQREENEALVRLKGLNEALNTASQTAVSAKARMQSVNQAINSGQAVVSDADTRTLSVLEEQAQVLREQLADLNQRFTKEYIELNPSLKVVPRNLAKLESQISRMRTSGKHVVLADAKQQYAAATQSVLAIKKQLQAHSKQAADFTTRFTEHVGLQNDLKSLELLFNETQERLIKIQAKQAERYPQVSVVERAFLPQQPIRPNYLQHTLIATIGSIIFSLCCVWFISFLNRKDGTNSAINLSGVHLYNNGQAHHNAINNDQFRALAQQQHYALETPQTREISNQDLDILLRASNDKGRQVIILLLSGLSLEEIALLNKNDINIDANNINVSGSSARKIPLNPVLKVFFSENDYGLSNDPENPLSGDDIAAIVHCSIVDAGLPASNEINVAAIRRNYIINLVMQGMRLSDLELVFGAIPPTELSSYSAYSPPVPGRPFQEIDLLHPSLMHLAA